MGVKQFIKSLHAFPRAEEHLLQKTQTGAVGNMLLFIPLLYFELKLCKFEASFIETMFFKSRVGVFGSRECCFWISYLHCS